MTAIEEALAWVDENSVRTMIACKLPERYMVRLCDAGDRETQRPHEDSAAYGPTWDAAAAEALKGLRNDARRTETGR